MKQDKTLKVAFYIRVSTEEQAVNPEGSIKSQEERMKATLKLRNMDGLWGECVGTYVDRARSGKDTNRPELQKLLLAIERREVSLVMVTELSRLTRSIRDFTSMKDLMDKHDCGLLSLRENFDSTTAAGEMVMYLMASLAQFERKQVSERVGANFHSRSSRGLYNGGCVPIGYRLNPDEKGRLLIDLESAPTVKKVFQTFLEQGTLSKTARHLNEKGFYFRPVKEGGRGLKKGLGHFTFQNVHAILKNPIYIAVKKFKAKGGAFQEAKAVWEPIIERETFEKVQALLKQNHCRGKSHEKDRYGFTLTGLASCSECGGRLIGKSAHGNGGKIPYYDHGSVHRLYQCTSEKPKNCFPTRVMAKVIEPLVWDEVTKVIKNPETAEALLAEAKRIYDRERVANVDPIQTRLKSLTERAETLSERLSELPRGVPAEPIYAQMKKLADEKAELEIKRDERSRLQAPPRMPASLSSYRALIEGLNAISKREDAADGRSKIIKSLVQKVEVCPEGIRIHFYAGEQEIKRGFNGLGETYIGGKKNLSVRGSNSFTNGGLSENRTRTPVRIPDFESGASTNSAKRPIVGLSIRE